METQNKASLLLFFSGAVTPTPTNMSSGGYPCPVGHYCVAGALEPQKCAPGTYAPIEGLGECKKCRAGYLCPGYNTTNPTPCPEGSYCPNGTSSVTGELCPTGTFNALQYRTKLSDCLPCPAGKYCSKQGLPGPNGDCHAGFLCISGAKTAEPDDGVNTFCPRGKYCLNGTTNATLCPIGTVRKSPGAASENDCQPCDPGMYCERPGLVEATGECWQGFYCPDYAKIKSKEPTSYPCPRGHYCGNRTSVPMGCEPGTYQPSDGTWYCLSCPASKYCPGNTTSPEECPPNHYCPNGTIAPPTCPNGTYSDRPGLAKSTDCSPCPAGVFCQNGVKAANCSGGYLCIGGSDIPNPNDNIRGVICPIGYYCPPGALEKQKCPKGYVINEEGRSSPNDCQKCPGGFICTVDSTVPQPCERGYYCPFNQTRQPCREGTYNNVTRATDEHFCKSCPAGYWCKGTGKYD